MALHRLLMLLSAILIHCSFLIIQVGAQSTTNYSEEAFDPALDKLPPQYIGHDPEVLANPLEKLAKSSKKTEFETTNEFNSRIQKQRALPILGNLTVDNIFAFSSYDVHANYDADHQTLDIIVSKLVFRSDRGLTLLSKILHYPEKYYEGVNAFGVRVNITEKNFKKFNIVLNNYRNLASKSKTDDSGYTTKIDYTAKLKGINAQLAKNSKENMRLLVICRIIEPFTTSGEIKYDATINHPVKLVESNTAIYTEVSELWFYNLSSGEIYAKLRQTRQNPSKKATSRPGASK